MTEPLLDVFSDVTVSHIPKADLLKGSFRLDASFHSETSRDAAGALVTSGLRVDVLGSLADVFCSNVRERSFVGPKHGHVLLAGRDLDVATDDDLRYVATLFTRNYESEKLQQGDILLSSAGTVGKCDLVWKNHEGRLASQDIVRIRPKEGLVPAGYLYAFFSSPLGRSLLGGQSSGSVIVRIYADRVDALGIPRLAKGREEQVAALVCSSFDARAASRLLLSEGANLTVSLCDLAPLPSIDDEEPDCSLVDMGEIASLENEFRVQANFYNSVARCAIQNLRGCPRQLLTVGGVTKEIRMSPLFVRKYVEQEHGVRYIAGKQLSQIRPDFKYISRSETEALHVHLLHAGWTLLTCAGSVGKVGYVSPLLDGVAAQDVMRVIPDPARLDSGYLNAWLRSSYGQAQLARSAYGSVIDRISPEQVARVLIPQLSDEEQELVGGKIRFAYELRERALQLEDEAQDILMREITTSREA